MIRKCVSLLRRDRSLRIEERDVRPVAPGRERQRGEPDGERGALHPGPPVSAMP